MSKHGKKYKQAAQAIDKAALYSVSEGFEKVKSLAYAKFDESVDVHINLGIDASKGEQAVRGSVLLPHGRGRVVKVLVFAKGDYADQAEKAGADYVGAEDLVEKISKGWIDFSYAIATPDLMGLVGGLAKFLGPRGLLPNKKSGTVTFDVAETVKDLKLGRAFFKNDKSGAVHFSIGKVSFDRNKLIDNFASFLKNLMAAKPASSKGKYIKSITVASSMGVGVHLSPDEALRSS